MIPCKHAKYSERKTQEKAVELNEKYGGDLKEGRRYVAVICGRCGGWKVEIQ